MLRTRMGKSFPTIIEEKVESDHDYRYELYQSPLGATSNATSDAQRIRSLDHFHENQYHADFTPQQELILNWTARIAAIFSFLGGLYIFYRTWQRRDQVYHRIMLAVSIYILLWSPWMMYGVAAIPKGTPDVLGAHGTTATCTAQGFFNQLSTAIPAYYVGLSGFSWIVIVHGNFDPSKYTWIEKYIHLLANAWAISSSTTLAVLEAFNPSEGWPSCYIASVPMGCGDTTGIECTRGPQNISQFLAVFVGLPVVVLLLAPSITMVTLACYLHWRKHVHPQTETDISITARAVTKQSAVYLGTLYFIYMPGLIMSSVGKFFGSQKYFWLSCMGNAITASMGFWFAITYRYFSAPHVSGGNGILGAARRRVSKILEPTFRGTLLGSCSKAFFVEEMDNDDSIKSEPVEVTAVVQDHQDQAEQVHPANIHSTVPPSEESPTESSFSEAPANERDQSKSSQEFRNSFSFNIFDGTAPSQSQWAEFIFEGDESDEENDQEETKYWAGCQGAM